MVPVPSGLRALLVHLQNDRRRHTGLMLDRFLKPARQQEQQREVLGLVAGLEGDEGLLAEHGARRTDSLKALGARQWSRTTSGPLTLHLARASALENAGLCLHPVYGFAYLPGTGLKGMARAYAETVWLPAQPEPDRASAWRTIEQVFGWAPGSDQIGREPKPWRPDGVPKRGDGEAAAAGAIVFHDAWPEKWPGLLVDIVNNHHPTYYRGDDAPGDWDSPNPVYFLAVKPGTKFSVALNKRRGDVQDALLERACEWLDGALTVLGCGAKTAAGYGYFTSQASAPAAERLARVATLRLVTPAFLAGAVQQEEDCDLRAATLRGQLRWWWRARHAGYLTVPELAALEAALWGDTKSGGAISLRLETIQRVGPRLFNYKDGFSPRGDFKRQHGLADPPNRRTTQGLFYAAYGMDEVSRGQAKRRFHLDAGSAWSLRLSARAAQFHTDRRALGDSRRAREAVVLSPEEVLHEAEAALCLLARFGGVGSKSRKGFGSLQAEWDVAVQPGGAARLRERVRLSRPFDLGLVQSPALDDPGCQVVEVDTPWSDPWQAMDHVGFAYQAFAQRYAHQASKAALGLPRKIHGPRDDGPMGGQVGWQPPEWLDFPRRPARAHPKDARHASPIHIHLDRRADGRLTVRAIGLPAPYLPDRGTSVEVLRDFMEFFRNELEGRGRAGGPRPQPQRQAPTTPQPNATVRVTVLERRPDQNNKPAFRVQEEGGRPGILTDGTPPASLPEVGAEVEVFRCNTDRNSPRYRWDRPAPTAPSPRRPPPRGR